MRELVKVFKALADKNRLRILKMLQERPLCVCEIRVVLGISQPSVSRHLSILKGAGLVEDRKEGVWTNYRLSRNARNEYVSLMYKHLKVWVNDDAVIVKDRKEVKQINRKDVCAIPGRM